MDGLTIGKKYNAQVAAVHLRDRRPPANPTVALNLLAHRMGNDMLDPFEANRRAIRAPTHVLEIPCEPHHGRLAQAWITRKTKPSNENKLSRGYRERG